MFVRIKNLRSSNNTMIPYAYLVENTWIPGKGSRQTVKKYLGRVKDIDVLDLKNLVLDKCTVCGTTKNLVPDHIIPLSKGGINKVDNIQCLCYKCNQKKGNN